MPVTLLGGISDIEIIAIGGRIRDLARLERTYGPGRWCKLKGRTRVRLPDGIVAVAEVHWYQAHGIGRREMKIKRLFARG